MCKSSAEGGQRCPGHALTAVKKATANEQAVQAAYERGEATLDQSVDATVATYDAQVAYASTIDGANDLTAQLDALDSDDDEHEERYEAMQEIIDDGARLAQVNREVENAYRATQGKGPLTTPIPQTFMQQALQEAEHHHRAAEKAAKEADPFGLRAQTQTPAHSAEAEDDDRYDGYDDHDDLNYPIHRQQIPDRPRVQSETTLESGERVRVESGHRKRDLKKGDVFLDAQGNMKRVVGDTGYGNLLVRRVGLRGLFSDPTRVGLLGEHTTKVLERNVKN